MSHPIIVLMELKLPIIIKTVMMKSGLKITRVYLIIPQELVQIGVSNHHTGRAQGDQWFGDVHPRIMMSEERECLKLQLQQWKHKLTSPTLRLRRLASRKNKTTSLNLL